MGPFFCGYTSNIDTPIANIDTPVALRCTTVKSRFESSDLYDKFNRQI